MIPKILIDSGKVKDTLNKFLIKKKDNIVVKAHNRAIKASIRVIEFYEKDILAHKGKRSRQKKKKRGRIK